jgi:hypothetical protein
MGTASTAAPERARWPRLTAAPRPRLRPLLARGYAGFTEATVPRHLVLPATTSVPLVVKLLDSPHRPPAFVMGAHGSSTVLEGDCAPSYLEVLLAPLGAYTLLGLPIDQLSGQIVDLVDVLGPAGRRLGDQLRETPSWRRRFALVDVFLLKRLERGPRPSPCRPGTPDPGLPPVHRDHPDPVPGPDAPVPWEWRAGGQFRSRRRRHRFLAWPTTGAG